MKSHDGFTEPRGLAVIDGRIFVADRAAHSVWELADGAKVPVAGTDRIGENAIRPGPGLQTDLRSPWGLAPLGRALVIAMAGSHQLWALDPDSGMLSRVAGTGGEELGDGRPSAATLAQPTGLAPIGDDAMAFADCESSAVRVLDAQSVRTLVGTGLFHFGDRSGVGEAALLQHCEDVAAWDGVLAVADTYNDRIKRVHPSTRECTPWPGEAGEAGSLREPAGLWSDGSAMIVCDTGHHRIARVERDGTLVEIALS